MGMEKLAKDISLTKRSTDGLGSLRKTRTSEVSPFVKNYNMAQAKAMRKEVEIWHKDTKFMVRTMNDRQRKLYTSLLRLSKEKKMIKNRREEVLVESKAHKYDIRPGIIQKTSRHRRRRSDRIADVLKLENANDEEKRISERERSRGGSNDCANIPMSGQIFTKSLPLTVTNLLNFEKAASKAPVNLNVNRHYASKTNIDSAGEQSEKSRPQTVSENDVIQEVSKANINDEFQLASKKQGHGRMNYDAESPMTSIRTKLGLSLTKPYHSTVETKTPIDQDLYPTENSSVIKSLTENVADETKVSANVFTNFKNMNKDVFFPELSYGNRRLIAQGVRDPNNARSLVKRNRVKKEREQIFLPPLKKPSDRSQELNQRSSMQKKEGKTYNLTTYKKDSKGNLVGEETRWNTTVDVAKYFNLESYRERLTRKRMLEDAKIKEQKQRERVDDYLKRLTREKEQARKDGELKKKREEEAQVLKRRLESLKKGPPKYGIGEDSVTPGYVRQYVRQPKDNRVKAKERRKRSSWCVPSLASLTENLGTNLLASSMNSTGTMRQARRGYHGMNFDLNFTSSHLVNINIDKYLIEATVQS